VEAVFDEWRGVDHRVPGRGRAIFLGVEAQQEGTEPGPVHQALAVDVHLVTGNRRTITSRKDLTGPYCTAGCEEDVRTLQALAQSTHW